MEKTMNLQKLALASALALASITSFAAPVAGKSSNPAYINVGSSTFQGKTMKLESVFPPPTHLMVRPPHFQA